MYQAHGFDDAELRANLKAQRASALQAERPSSKPKEQKNFARSHFAFIKDNGHVFYAQVPLHQGRPVVEKIVWRANPHDATKLTCPQAQSVASRVKGAAIVRKSAALKLYTGNQ